MSVSPDTTVQVDQQFERIACAVQELNSILERIARAIEAQATTVAG